MKLTNDLFWLSLLMLFITDINSSRTEVWDLVDSQQSLSGGICHLIILTFKRNLLKSTALNPKAHSWVPVPSSKLCHPHFYTVPARLSSDKFPCSVSMVCHVLDWSSELRDAFTEHLGSVLWEAFEIHCLSVTLLGLAQCNALTRCRSGTTISSPVAN